MKAMQSNCARCPFEMATRICRQEDSYIVVDEFSAWVATDNGVLKFDKARKRWEHFTTEDGLLSNYVNCIMLDGDYVWFGTPEGLTRFYWNAPYRID